MKRKKKGNVSVAEYGQLDWRAAVGYSNLSLTTKGVLQAVGLHLSSVGLSCYPSVRRLAAIAGCGEKAARTHLRLAEKKGWIRITPRPGTSNLIKALIPEVFEKHPYLENDQKFEGTPTLGREGSKGTGPKGTPPVRTEGTPTLRREGKRIKKRKRNNNSNTHTPTVNSTRARGLKKGKVPPLSSARKRGVRSAALRGSRANKNGKGNRVRVLLLGLQRKEAFLQDRILSNGEQGSVLRLRLGELEAVESRMLEIKVELQARVRRVNGNRRGQNVDETLEQRLIRVSKHQKEKTDAVFGNGKGKNGRRRETPAEREFREWQEKEEEMIAARSTPEALEEAIASMPNTYTEADEEAYRMMHAYV